MVDRIRIGTNTVMAGELRNFIRYLRMARDAGEHVKEVMEENIDAANYTDLETEFGLSQGQGVAVYDLVVGATAVVLGTSEVPLNPAIQQLIACIG